MSLPKDYNTDASVGQVRIDVQATTGGPKPEAPPGGATLPAEWKPFEGLNVIVSGYRRMPPNNQLEEVVIANEPLGEGAHRAFDVTLPPGGLWEETNAGQAVLVVKLIQGGKAIVEKSVPAPIGGSGSRSPVAPGRMLRTLGGAASPCTTLRTPTRRAIRTAATHRGHPQATADGTASR